MSNREEVPAKAGEVHELSMTGDSGVFALCAEVLRRRVLVVRIALLCGAIAGAISFAHPRTFTSEASFVPRTGARSATGLSAIAAQFQVSLPAGDVSQSPGYYQRLLHSRAVLDAVLEKNVTIPKDGATRSGSVLEILGGDSTTTGVPSIRRAAVIRQLSQMVQVEVDIPIGLLNVRVQASSAVLAQQLLQHILDALNQFNVAQRRASARAELDFMEKRVREAKQELSRAEDNLQRFGERNRLSSSTSMIRVEQERLLREVTREEQLVVGLQQALEQSRIEEIRDTPLLRIVEEPSLPLRPDRRGTIVKMVIAAVLGGLAVAFVLVLAMIGIPSTISSSDRVTWAHLFEETMADLRRPWRLLKPAGGTRYTDNLK